MNRLMRHSNGPTAARAFAELLSLSRRAEALGVAMWIDLYVPRTELSAREMYRAVFNFKAALDTLEAERDEARNRALREARETAWEIECIEHSMQRRYGR